MSLDIDQDSGEALREIPRDIMLVALMAAREIHDTDRPHSLIIAEAIMSVLAAKDVQQ